MNTPYRSAARLSCTAFGLLVATGAAAQETDDEKIRAALAAAPPEVSAGATVLDWPAEPGGEFRVLRDGNDTWTCLPDKPGDANYEPMCNDAEWMRWMRATLRRERPVVTGVGISYMLNARWATSNVDPGADEATPDNVWVEGGPHLMIVVPDESMLDQYPKEPGSGAYVMWAGTPWVHLMVPMDELVETPPR